MAVELLMAAVLLAQTPAKTPPSKAPPAPAPAAPPAATPPATGTKPATAKPAEPKGQTLDEALQKRPLVLANLKLLSLGVPTSFNFGLMAGVNIWKIATVELDATTGQQSLTAFDSKVGSLTQTYLGGRVRIYPTLKYLNVLLGYGGRALEAELEIGGLKTGNKITARSRVAEIGFGHRIHLDRLSLGADWVVVHYPIGEANVSQEDGLLKLDDELKKDAQKVVELLDDTPSISLLNLYIGFGW